MEEEVELLVKGELLKRIDNKVQTNFIIKNKSIYLECLNTINDNKGKFIEKILSILEENKQNILDIDFYGSKLSWDRLLWILIPYCSFIITDQFSKDFTDKIPFDQYPLRTHGGKWIAMGQESLSPEIHDKITIEKIKKASSNGPVSSGSKWWYGTNWSGFDPKPFEDFTDEDINLCKDIATRKIDECKLSNKDKERLSIGIKKGYIKKGSSDLSLNFPIFTKEQLKSVEKASLKAYPEIKSTLSNIYNIVYEIVLEKTPKHLQNEIEDTVINVIAMLIPLTISKAVEEDILSVYGDEWNKYLSFFIRL